MKELLLNFLTGLTIFGGVFLVLVLIAWFCSVTYQVLIPLITLIFVVVVLHNVGKDLREHR